MKRCENILLQHILASLESTSIAPARLRGGGGNFGVLSGSMKLRTIVSKRAINLLRQNKVIDNLVREI